MRKPLTTLTQLTLLTLLPLNFALAAATESERCAESGDSLDIAQAEARVKWAFKCFPDLRGSMPHMTASLKDTATGAVFPGYPTFGVIDENGSVISFWQAPADADAPCESPRQHAYIGMCRAGCYTPDQLILFADGFESILKANKSKRDDIMTLSPDSALGALSFKQSKLESYTVDPVPKQQKILVIKTQDGGQLKVTTNHPLVDSEGRMRSADTLKVGESLVKMDGDPDRIVSIESTDYFGKVYNVSLASQDPAENIVVAQGYLNGSVYFQNEGLGLLNRLALRVGNVIPNSLVK